MTIYHSYIPQSPLATFVDAFWLYEGSAPAHAKERILPHGSMQLIINLREDMIGVYDRQRDNHLQRFGGCLISGAYSEFSVIDTASLVSVMGASFKPDGAFPFLKLPAGELHNMDVSLETLWGLRPMIYAINCWSPRRRGPDSVFLSRPFWRG